MKNIQFKQSIPWVLAFVVSTGLGLFFRTYLLHHDTSPRPDKLLASLYVEKVIVDQIQQELAVTMPQASADDKVKMARDQARRMIEADRANYDRSVEEALQSMKDQLPRLSGRRYLLEADPYYYYYLTQKLIETGKLSDQIGGGKYYHPLMHAPYGYWTSITWHPYVGRMIGTVVRLFSPEMNWMEALGWVPLVLTVLACGAFFVFARVLGFNVFQTWVGSLALVLSPIFVQRSGYGWYDTDPYNYIFPFLILASSLKGIKSPDKIGRFAALSGLLTGLYGLFWTGWPFIFVMVPAAVIAGYLGVRIIGKFYAPACTVYLRFLWRYGLFSLIFLGLFLTPAGLWDSIRQGWEILMKFSLSDSDVWPNIFLTVGEARGISVKKLIFLSGNYITFGIAVFGLFSAGFNAWQSRKQDLFFQWIFLFCFSIPLFLMPLQTERFGILFVIALATWVAFGIGAIQNKLTERLVRFPLLQDQARPVFVFCRILIALVFLPLPLITAHIISPSKPIMDDAWYGAMEDIRTQTEPDAIINSWWPPGYFILGLGQRRVVADGGTQHLQESYWLARILAAQDENQSAGFLRMLNHSGNDALLFLKAAGMDLTEAVNLITAVVSVPKEEAIAKLPADMPEHLKNRFLELTHGGGKTPSYVLVYTDMIHQNLAVTMIARWNFSKAKAALSQKKSGAKSLLGGGGGRYADDFINMTDGVLKYMPATDLLKKEGDILFFGNGLSVNLKEKDALIHIPEKKVKNRPASLFYIENGEMLEKKFEGEHLDLSVLLIPVGEDHFQAVLADSRLIRSLMFRLYYLKGAGVKNFTLFSDQRNPLNGDQVLVFKLNSNVSTPVPAQAEISV